MKYNLHKQHYLKRSAKAAFVHLFVALAFVNVSTAADAGPTVKIRGKSTLSVARINVTGTVKDAKGEPLPGVTVKIKGSNTGTSTDLNGVFRLNLPTGNETLVFSFLGFKTQEIAAGGQTTLEIRMQDDTQSLDEVIVTGYGGTTTKGATTGAIDAIKAEEIEDLPVGNLSAALSGRLLGVNVSGGTTRPGTAGSITLRNPMSFSSTGASSSPLYIIDDVIQVTSQGLPDNTLFNSLDASEIESITVLKDASAAIYGSRAANGAIIVTTKRGKEGPPRISYSGQVSVNDEAYRTTMLNAYEMAEYVNIMNGSNGHNQEDDPELYFFSPDEMDHFRNINHDWLESNWKASRNMRHTFNVSGGAQNSTYFANVSYYTQDGNIGRLDHNRYTYRAGADVNLLTGLKAGLQVSGNYQQVSRINNELGGENAERDYMTLLQTPRYIPMYVDGYPVRVPGTGYHFNEIERTNNYREAEGRTTVVNLYAEYELPFLKGLKARAAYSRSMNNASDERIGGRYLAYEFTKTGTNRHIYEGATNPVSEEIANDDRIRFFNDRGFNSQFNFLTSYNNSFGKHSVGAFLTVERQESKSNREEVRREHPIIGSNGQLNTAFGEIGGTTTASEAGTLGYIGRANYSFDGKYLVDFMFRSDASTKFAPENYWGKFYSLGAGWVISQEDFFSLPAVNFLKLRYSVGLLGKDDTGPWMWRQRYTYQNGKGNVFGTATNIPAGTGMKMEQSPNRNAVWSDEVKHNLGIDARFLDSRLSATAEGFFNRGTNMLIARTAAVPITVGGSLAATNYGDADFFGYELGIGWNDNIGKDFRYGIDTRFQWYDNKVHKANFNDTDILYPWNKRPGESDDNGRWGYDYIGMFQNQAEIQSYIDQYGITEVLGTNAEDLRPGMLYYRDVRGSLQADGTFAAPDGIIDNNDQIQLSKKAQNHYGFGITLRAGYKGFSFDAVISGSFGGWAEHTGRSQMDENIDDLDQNQPALWRNIYDPELNPNGIMPNPAHREINLTPVSRFWQVNAFRMRMRNLNMSYSIPQRIAETLRVRNARVSLTIINPINFYNPFTYRDSEGGWDQYPLLRTFSFGVNLSL